MYKDLGSVHGKDLDQLGPSPSLISLQCLYEESEDPHLPIKEYTAKTLIRLGRYQGSVP